MTRANVLEIAKTMPKKSWDTYSFMKKMLSEYLDNKEYEQFIKDLTKILQI